MTKKKQTALELVANINKTGKIKIVGRTSGHLVPVETYSCSSAMVSGVSVIATVPGYPAYTFYVADLELHAQTKAALKEELAELKKDAKEIEAKLAFIEENGVDEYSDTQFKVWNTLKVLKTKDSDFEKAKLIAELIEG